jgi:hypothetical protein
MMYLKVTEGANTYKQITIWQRREDGYEKCISGGEEGGYWPEFKDWKEVDEDDTPLETMGKCVELSEEEAFLELV